MTNAPTLFLDCSPSFGHDTGHILYMGSSGTGKTQSLIGLARKKISNPLTGLIVIDPDGEIAPACYDYIANPAHRLGWRTVHYLRPASSTETFALPILHVPDCDPLACHNKAVRAKEIFQQAVTVGAGDYGPRLSKFFYLGCLGLALTGRPLVDLPDLFARGAHYLRDLISAAMPFPFLADEWSSVDLLSERQFLEYRDPLMSRLLPIFGNAQLRRVFGPQQPVDIASILRNRDVALLDLSGLEHADAVLVGKAFFNFIYHEALQRSANREPHMCVMVDEAFDYITADMARGFDRLRKRNLQLCVAIQRLAQLTKNADEDAVSTLSAIISGTRTKVLLRVADPDDAEYMARVFFAGFMPLNEWKDGTERPVAVGQQRIIAYNRSNARSRARHDAVSNTETLARGTGRTRMTSCTEADGVSETHGTSEATADGTMTADAFASGVSTFDGISHSTSMNPPPDTLFFAPEPDITGLVDGANSGAGTSSASSHASGFSTSRTSGSSHARSTSRSTAITEAVGISESEVRGQARGRMRGNSVSESESSGESETFVTAYEWMPSQLYSLAEQLQRLAGELQNLALRECFVKIENARPVRTRTTDLAPAFKSANFRRIMVPLFHAKAVTQSPYLFPIAEVDALLAAREAEREAPVAPLPDSVTEPFVSDNPQEYAAAFWKRQSQKDPSQRPRKSADRAPKIDRPTKSKLRIIDGGDKPK